MHLHSAQRVIYRDSKAQVVIARCGRKFGKSRGARYRVAKAIERKQPIAYVAPEYKYLYGWVEELQRIYGAVISNYNQQKALIEFNGGASLRLFSMDNIDAMRPYEFSEVIIDEAAASRYFRDAYVAAIKPTLIKRQGRCYILSTPRVDAGGGYFRELCERAKDGDADIAHYHYTSYDNPYLDHAEIDKYRSEVSTRIFNQEILADFVDVDGARIKTEWLQYAEPTDEYTYVMGVDLAISEADNADYTACVCIAIPPTKDLPRIVMDAKRIRKTSLTEIVNFITTFGTRWSVDKCGIENVTFQRLVVDEVRKEKPQWYVKGMPATKSKLNRFLPLEGRIEHGGVKLSRNVQKDFVDELLMFTGEGDAHDHYIDALVHGDNVAAKSAMGAFIV